MTDAELIARLREYREINEGSTGVSYDPIPECLAAADRIEELEAKLKTSEEIGKAFEEDAGQLRAKLAKAVKALELIVVDNTWGLEHQTYMKCRKALAEIKSGVATTPYGLEGESHD